MKKYLFLLILPILFLLPKDTFALTPSKLVIYASDYTVLDSCETGNCTYAANDTGRPSRFRFTIPSTIYTGYTYRVRAKFTIITDSSYNITFNDPQMLVDGTAQTLSINKWSATSNNVSNMMRTKVWELAYDFTSKNTSVGHHYPPFVEFSLKSGDVPSGTNYQVIWEFDDVDIVATSDNTGSVIQNSTQEIIDNDNKNTDKIVQSQEEIKDAITDDSSPDISSLDDAAGWLPAGPLDSVLNLPLTMFQNINNALGGSCSPITLTIPIVDYPLVIPCMSTIYSKIGISSFLEWLGVIAGGIIMYNYLLHLYQWVEDRLTLKEGKIEWGGN